MLKKLKQRRIEEFKEREVIIYEVAQVFCMGNNILLCNDHGNRIQEKMMYFKAVARNM